MRFAGISGVFGKRLLPVDRDATGGLLAAGF
jgi:hypothetical protein